ncbi:Uma2 domain-containing protein [Gammaproteobacteria bacterium]
MRAAVKYFTREEYLAMEEITAGKYEFYQGEIFAMAGGTFNHSMISGNIFSALKTKLRAKFCQPTNSDMRVETPNGLITYPDAAVFCGKPELSENQCSLLNPAVIIEVLSSSTRRYDLSDKFLLYRAIPSFHDYLLIDSEKIHAQYFHKIRQHEWILHEYFESHDVIDLLSIQETLSLQEIYETIIF